MFKLNGRMFNIGDSVTFNSQASAVCHAPAGLKVRIERTRDDLIGLHSIGRHIDGWGDLDGNVGELRGWWIHPKELELIIQEGSDYFEITKPYKYKGVDLKGKPCKLVGHIQGGSVFIEFEEDINGCSADGLGKSGHCVAVDPRILKTKEERKKKSAE